MAMSKYNWRRENAKFTRYYDVQVKQGFHSIKGEVSRFTLKDQVFFVGNNASANYIPQFQMHSESLQKTKFVAKVLQLHPLLILNTQMTTVPLLKEKHLRKNLQLNKLYSPISCMWAYNELPNEVQARHIPKPKPHHLVLFAFAFTNTQKNKWGNTDNYISHEDFVSYEWDDVLGSCMKFFFNQSHMQYSIVQYSII